jgi:hypothetical protein
MINLKVKLPQVGSKNFNFEIKDNHIVCDFENQILDFIISYDNILKIGKGHYKLSNKSEYVFFAGRLLIINGKISYIDNDSGHYIPNNSDLENVILYFRERNLLTEDFEYKLI